MHAHGGHGSHGGHGGHGQHSDQTGADTVRDPVCGMAIQKSQSARSMEYQGQVYYFCSEKCFHSFTQDPSRYGHSGGHQHQ